MKYDEIITIPRPTIEEIVSENHLRNIGNINLFGDERVGVPRSGARSLIHYLSPNREKQILFVQQNREPFDFEAYLHKLKIRDGEKE